MPLSALVEQMCGVQQNPVKWVRINPDHALLGTMRTEQTEEMWSTMLEESKDVVAESEAIHGRQPCDADS